MSENMSMITARDPDIVAAEINTIKKNVQQIMIAGALEIGGKLVEAKGMVPHGQWGKWLEEKVNYSQSTANNMMKLYQEYGGNQQSLFDTWTNSQTFAEMSYTQHLALLALPFSERQEFAESNQVADMSTRELERKIREELTGKYQARIDAAEQRAADAEEQADDAIAELEVERASKEHIRSLAKRDADKADEYLQQKQEAEKALQEAEKEKAKAEKSEKIALDLAEKLKRQLEEAETREQIALADLENAKNNPDVPDAVMESMRKEVEAEAAKKAADDFKAQLDAARQAAEKAEREKTAAVEAARVAAGKLEEVQKASKLADPNMMAIQTLVENIMTTWNTIQGHRMKAVAANPNNAAPLHGFLSQVVENLRAGLGEQ